MREIKCAINSLANAGWADVLWNQEKIAVAKRWSRGKEGPTKTRKSEGHVPLHPAVAECHREWHDQTAYAKGTDFLFPSLKAEGRVGTRIVPRVIEISQQCALPK